MGILVCTVEDDAALLASIAFSLRSEGYETQGFATARALRASTLELGRVDCFVLDQVLPDESGLDLLGTLRGAGVVAPAILITTNPSQLLRTRAGELDAVIVEKPLLGNTLSRTIRSRLVGRAAGGPAR